jgi:hypothetical protein
LVLVAALTLWMALLADLASAQPQQPFNEQIINEATTPRYVSDLVTDPSTALETGIPQTCSTLPYSFCITLGLHGTLMSPVSFRLWRSEMAGAVDLSSRGLPTANVL